MGCGRWPPLRKGQRIGIIVSTVVLGAYFIVTKVPWTQSAREQALIFSYLATYESLCNQVLTPSWISANANRNDSDKELCPCVSPLLVGRRVPNVAELRGLSWAGVYRSVGETGPGGHWRPNVCRPRLRVAVVIPYRDRERDLRAQLATLYPILQRQLLEFRIFVVEQTWPALYNKGANMNIGFLEADVDLIMEDDRNLIYCLPDQPLHLGAFLDEQHYRLKYLTIVGGALAFTPRMFQDLNGYTTLYFGWGGEDDNMKGRMNRKTINLARASTVARYTHIKNLQRGDPSNPVGKYRNHVLKKLPAVDPETDGLSSLIYRVAESADQHLFTWISVVLSVKSLVTYQNRTTYIYNLEPERNCNGSVGKVIQDIDASFTTCKYLCDMKEECVGFSVRRDPDIRCELKTGCQLGLNAALTAETGAKQTLTKIYTKNSQIEEQKELGLWTKLSYHIHRPSI